MSYMIEKPMLEGERIQRVTTVIYNEMMNTSETRKEKGVNFEAASKLIDELTPFSNRRVLSEAIEHLQDSLNEGLPLKVREEHYDIAGALIWREFQYPERREPDFTNLMSTWQWGGGI